MTIECEHLAGTTFGSHTVTQLIASSHLAGTVFHQPSVAPGTVTVVLAHLAGTALNAAGVSPVVPITATWATAEATPDWRVLITKPLLDLGNMARLDYRWAEMEWPHAEVEPQELAVSWALDRPGTCTASFDAATFERVWAQTDFDPGGSGVRYLAPDSTTVWVVRDGSPVFGGFLRDVTADPAAQDSVTIEAEEFTGNLADVSITDDYVDSLNVDAQLEALLALEAATAKMGVHVVNGAVADIYDVDVAGDDNVRIGELVDRMAAYGAGFEWAQWIDTRADGQRTEALFGIGVPTLGDNYAAALVPPVEWGRGTAETALRASYSVSSRSTRTRWKVNGAGLRSIVEYVGPLGIPRRDGHITDQQLGELDPAEVEAVARQHLTTFGLPLLTVRATMRVGRRWPWLWRYPIGKTRGGGPPLGSKFRVRINHAGLEYSSVSRASTWQVELGPGRQEHVTVDLVPVHSDIAPEVSVVE